MPTTKPFLKSASTSLVLALAIGASGAYAQSQPGQANAGSAGQAEMKVGHVDHTRSMDNLLAAAQKFREAIQAMARQEPGPKRDAAMDATREALLLTQRAMLQLPPDLRVEDVKVREAKDWPKAMARLDSASQKLHESIEAMSKQQGGKGRDDAIGTVKTALDDTEEAMLAIPEYSLKK